MELFLYAALWILGFMAGIGLTTIFVYTKGDAFVHRMRYKEWVLPCPACRDENDEPTGMQTFENEFLKRQAREWTEGGELPTFTCTTCGGTKVVRYEFLRTKPPTINERQMITSTLPDQLPNRRRIL